MTRRTLISAVAVVAALLVCSASLARAKQIQVPLQFDHEFVRQALLAQVYGDAGARAKLWNDGTGCGFLTLWNPQVVSADGRLRIVTQGEAQIGTPIGDSCLAPLQWQGTVEVDEVPVLSADRQSLQFRVIGSNLLDKDRRKGLLTGRIWDLVKEHLHPRFETVRVELHSALNDLRELLPLVMMTGDTRRIDEMLESLRLETATVSNDGVRVGLGLTVPPSTTPVVPAPEPTLSAAELARWETSWQRWDAFITFVVKIFGTDIPAKDIQLALRDVLLEARFDILDALAPQPGVSDPTRALFMKTWERLAPVVRHGAASLPGSTGLRYLSFVTAGDALAALDQAGPEVGLDISAAGLRRLARMVAPYTTDDPLAYSEEVDPGLRQLLGFGAPLPPPDFSDMPIDEEPGSAPNPDSPPAAKPEAQAAGASEPTPEASAAPTPASTEVPSPSSWLRRWLQPALAHAATEAPAAASLQHWVADPDRLDAYLQGVREVLLEVAAKTLKDGGLEPKYNDLYRKLVLTTAWQESCWRQFLRGQNGRVTYMASSVGATGMMQVHEKVWRGLYDIKGLRWDIRYNGRAGAEILLHYLSDYAIKKNEQQFPGGVDNLARATYAVYNGGPGHLSRYRKAGTKPLLKKIDELFLEKYKTVSAGRELEVRQCFAP